MYDVVDLGNLVDLTKASVREFKSSTISEIMILVRSCCYFCFPDEQVSGVLILNCFKTEDSSQKVSMFPLHTGLVR